MNTMCSADLSHVDTWIFDLDNTLYPPERELLSLVNDRMTAFVVRQTGRPWPEALEATIRRAWEVTGGRTPLLVTENGIGTDDDEQRISYVDRALRGVQRALADGIDVRSFTPSAFFSGDICSIASLPTVS